MSKRVKSKYNQEAVPMILSKNLNRIYYVISFQGICKILEINPKNDQEITNVMEIRTRECYGFKVVGDDFYFMDDL